MFNFNLLCATLRAARSKSYAFSTNYYACIAIPTWHRCATPILFWTWPHYNLLPRSCLTILTDGYHFACIAFSTNYHACIVMPTWCWYAPPILFWPLSPFNLSQGQLGFRHRSSLIGTTLRALPIKSGVIMTNDHACIAIRTRCRCAPPIYFFTLTSI